MMTIRSARQDEAAILADVGLRAWEKAMIPVGETKAMVENARTAFWNFVSSEWLTITVIEQNGDVAGWAARENLDEDITDFWIDPVFQGQGLGTALLEAVEKEIRHLGFEKATLETHAMNREGLHFFEKHGYSVHWLTIAYNPKLDRDIQTVGLTKAFVAPEPVGYGQEF